MSLTTAILGGFVILLCVAVNAVFSCHRIWKINANASKSWRAHQSFYEQEVEHLRSIDVALLDPATLHLIDGFTANAIDNKIRSLEWAKYFEGQVPYALRKWYLRDG